MSTPRRSRGPSVVYGSLTTAMIVLFGAVTLTASAPPPPAIAEFAPEAVRQITDAPEEQQQLAVRGPGQGPGAEADATASPEAATDAPAPSAVPTESALPIHRVPRAHTCVGSPPRQTEDPQSPPCVAFYQGKLLGATTRGVTANEIRVVVPCDAATEGDAKCEPGAALDLNAFEAFYNERFELYGRKIKIIRHRITRPLTITNMIKDAQAIEALEPFAVLDYLGGVSDTSGFGAVFFRELARRKIVNVQGLQLEAGTYNVDQAELQAAAPYSWTYQPTTDMILTTIGDLICTNLVGRKPWFDVHRNPAIDEPTVRKFGITVPEVPENSANLDIGPLTRRLDSCQAPHVEYAYNPADQHAGAATVVKKFYADGVTTVVVLAVPLAMTGWFQGAARNESYTPEWISSNIYGADAQFIAANIQADEQRQRTFGLRSDNKPRPQQKTYNYQAVKEYDSNYRCCDRRGFYQGLMLLASGIQMAGPNLTPETFQQALYDTKWPANSTAGGPPEWHSAVDFGPGDHTMQSDFMFQSMNPNEINNDNNLQGAYCDVEKGVRYGPGELNRTLRFFNAGRGAGPDPCRG